MVDRIADARESSTAFRKGRLIDFETGSEALREPEHTQWLQDTINLFPKTREFWIHIYGYASKLRPRGARSAEEADAYNSTLSFNRAGSVAAFLEKHSPPAPSVTSRISKFMAKGNRDYIAAADDNSAQERAVEVHMFLADLPPPPPPSAEPICKLPGGKRYSRWSVATPFGITLSSAGAAGAVNVVVFRRDEPPVLHRTYLVPGFGAGYAWPPVKISKIRDMIKLILSGMAYSGMSFTPTTAINPFNFYDLRGASCMIASAGAGVGPGYLKAKVSVSGKIWYCEGPGKPFTRTGDMVKDVDTSGKDLQFGIGGSAVGGAMIEI